jgi:hypothetical protein
VTRRSRGSAVALAVTAAVLVVPVGAVESRSCGSVVNPYPGTRYEGVDLRRISARNVSCRRARQVARGAHRRALGITPPVSGVRRFRWGRWRVTGDLRGSVDRYLATAPGRKRVRWVF